MVISESELHLKNAKSSLATVEIDVDSLEAQGKTFPDVICESLVEYAEDQWGTCFSVYTYFTQSVTFLFSSVSKFLYPGIEEIGLFNSIIEIKRVASFIASDPFPFILPTKIQQSCSPRFALTPLTYRNTPHQNQPVF